MNNSNGSNGDNPKGQDRENAFEDKTDEFLDDLKRSLSSQVNETIRVEGAASYNNNDPEINKQPKGLKDKQKNLSKVIKYVVIPMVIILLTTLFLTKTNMGRNLIVRIISNYSYGKLDYEAAEQPADTEDTGENPVTDTSGNTNQKPTENKTVSNILLIGVETFEGAQNTDTMIIASLDSKNNVIKLTSLMRDLYVQLPGYKNNKLNAAYANGGIKLLYDTIEVNFGLTMDGYVLVDFNDFEQIIDYFGGIDLELTSKEAEYLRTTNYISEPANRDVVAGVQHMNGNQVLGYCRIRKVSTKTESSDFGRTQRQRIVLEKIFEKLRKKNVIQLGLIMNNIISNIDIKTDITKTDYNSYLQQAVYLEKNEIKTFRVPKDDSYNSERVQIGRYKQDVLVPKSWEDTKNMLRDFIYGANH
ncbi:MAG: cell envelope-related transcriptional attenuator [Herbinix sp.]|jgi:LCP family protein required for cell wall assembly|nr:cell envelope-related transcriptional attenuator [Herbinix sp.]